MTDADDIAELDDATVEKIAAGEVVERPASVVKELIENSLDAGASRVEVDVERGGKDLVRVRDDGEGMTGAAVRKAVRPHTTSKIEDIRDLESGVGTLGFRGEALPTIGAVSKLRIRTKPRGADAGTELLVEGGEVVSVEPTGCPEGTTVEVTDLFYNTPARRKYLKRDRTEFARVNDVATKYALACPDVAVSLEHDGREVFATTGQGDLRAAIMSVYGREVAEAMLPVDADGSADDRDADGATADDRGADGATATDGDADGATAGDRDVDSDADPEGPLDRIEGYVGHPETTRSSREYVSAFVNGRYVQSAAAREAVVEAYGDQLAPDRYPFAVLFLAVPPGEVDVNVHPRKLEVRFADEAGVREQVREAVRAALLEHGLVRSGAPRGRSAPEEATVRPEPPGAIDDGAEARGDGRDDATPAGDAPVEPPETAHGSADADAGSAPASGADAEPSSGSDAADSTPPPDAAADGADPSLDPAAADSAPAPDTGSASGSDADADGAEPGSTARGPASGRKFDAATQRTLEGEPASVEPDVGTLPPLRVLGQYDDTYVVAEGPDGLVLIDQHAADERVAYERLRERLGGDASTQALAEPVELELTAGEAALLEASEETLAGLGFRTARAGDRTVEVTAVPAVLADALEPALLGDVLSRALAGEDADRPVEARADELLADLACHPAVTANTSLTEGSVVALLEALDACENPYACPHGRPVLVEIDADEIADRFERDYPGRHP